jgi:outer membrane lipoprotein-sorting protein
MRPAEELEKLVKKLRYEPSAEAHNRVLRTVLGTFDQSGEGETAGIRPTMWRITMRSRMGKLAAAVIAVLVVGGVTFWPGGSGNGKWWLGPPAAWGQEIIESLEDFEALVYREQFVHISLYGSTHVSGQWSRNYQATDRSRQDTYFEPTDEDTYSDHTEDSVLHHITWKIPEGDDLIRYDVSSEFQCYTIKRRKGMAYEEDPVEKLRSYVNLLDNADRILETKVFEGKECVGFEIGKGEYGSVSARGIDRIWLDTETKLPVRIEKHARDNRLGKRYAIIHDQFEYYAVLPAEMFQPDIPHNFINAEPSDMRVAREKEEKGEMIYADVPEELRNEIVAAIKDAEEVVYRKRFGHVRDGNWSLSTGDRVYISQYDWKQDSFRGDNLLKTEWFITDQNSWTKTDLDFNTEEFKVIQTVVDYRNKTYQVITHGHKAHPENPMDRIVFLVGMLHKADRVLENEVIDGVECFGFELSAKKYGSNPDTHIHKLWFDAETKLPVKMIFEWLQDDGPRMMVTDQFGWSPELPADTFTPWIPEGFHQRTSR